jgi:hypothetical protein
MLNSIHAAVLVAALLPSMVVAAPHQGNRAGAGQQNGGMSCMQGQQQQQGQQQGQQQQGNNAAANGKAIYMITNDKENAVVALPIGQDGTLSKGTVTKTGGCGSVAVNAMGQPATPDALVGQSALTMAGNVSRSREKRVFIKNTTNN